MKYTVLLFCWALTAAPAPAQALADRKAAFGFFDSVFARPTCQFIKLEPGLPVGMDTIILRFNNAVAANRQWFNAYKDKYAASGQQLPYDPHFGITYKEYRRILQLASAPIRLAPSDTQTVTVLREAGLVHFRSAGENHLLDYLLVDPVHRLLMYGGDTIPFAGFSDPGLANRIGLTATGQTTPTIGNTTPTTGNTTPTTGNTTPTTGAATHTIGNTTHTIGNTTPTTGAATHTRSDTTHSNSSDTTHATGVAPTPIDWQGYSWHLEKTDIATGIDGIRVAARVVQVDLGLAAGLPNPLIRIHYEQLRADSTVSNFDLIGYIH